MTAESVVAGVENLLSLPDAAVQLSALLSDPHATTAEIAEVISIDPSLSARVLRLVSSAYFGLHAPVETVSRAITMIGIRELHLLVLATSAARAFNNISTELVNMEAFWQHSVGAALAAGSLAARRMPRHRERIFLAALLHDIGQLVMYHQLPEVSNRILEAMARGERREFAERVLLGFTHADVGAVLLKRWNLPASLTEPVRYHGRCAEAPNHGIEAALIHLGCAVAHHMERSRGPTGYAGAPDVDPGVWALAGRHPGELEEVMLEVDMNWFQVINLIAPHSTMLF